MTDERFMSSGNGSIVLSFLAGAVAGAAVALLTTPKSGYEMREQLRSWARDSKVGDAVQRAAHSARRAFDEVVTDVNPDH